MLILEIFIFVIFLIKLKNINQNKSLEKKGNLKNINKEQIYPNKSEQKNISYFKCYAFSDNPNIRIIHLIITRFLILFYKQYGFPLKLYRKDYILNSIRVMKKYLFPSLENQSCKNFTWILLLGNEANITYIKEVINFNHSFEYKIIYQKDFKNYVRNISKGFDVLITTRIDYDDVIYYDAVNDLRKALNLNKPMVLYGYNRGIIFFESEGKSLDFFFNSSKGCWSVFFSLITVLKQVNDSYTILDLGSHSHIRKNLLGNYKLFGIKEINYEPAIFDTGDIKFAWVRQKYSGSFDFNGKINNSINTSYFNLNKLFGI